MVNAAIRSENLRVIYNKFIVVCEVCDSVTCFNNGIRYVASHIRRRQCDTYKPRSFYCKTFRVKVCISAYSARGRNGGFISTVLDRYVGFGKHAVTAAAVSVRNRVAAEVDRYSLFDNDLFGNFDVFENSYRVAVCRSFNGFGKSFITFSVDSYKEFTLFNAVSAVFVKRGDKSCGAVAFVYRRGERTARNLRLTARCFASVRYSPVGYVERTARNFESGYYAARNIHYDFAREVRALTDNGVTNAFAL